MCGRNIGRRRREATSCQGKKDKPIWNTFDEINDEEGCYGLFDDDDKDFADGGHIDEVEMEPV